MIRYYGKLAGYGKAIPETVITNDELSKKVDTTDEWIRERTGIRERHVVKDGEHCSDLATQAAQAAMDKAGITAEEVDLIIVATSSPDYLMPPVSSQVQHNLGAAKAGAFSMVVGCTGFVYSLVTADQFIRSGQYRNIVVIGVEVISRNVDWNDRNTCVLFGDGAAAVVIQRTEDENKGMLAHHLGSDGSGLEHIIQVSGGTRYSVTPERLEQGMQYLKMNGREVFKFASVKMGEALKIVLDETGYSSADIDLFIPHQANARIIEFASRQARLPAEKVFVNVDRYGNTSAASVPIALTEAFEQNRLKEGDLLALVAFGAGLTWASCLFRV
ncbi:3-oxoacyl-[acyl-carrier-protein] synthase-3 [Cyclonatronum proteinivorum]|uniref:Beta-ketoacyl-[acyl-carrier-protein] synthase III n=1 Tax=Cyclonatronum proteinivorum TaxID=1457365 RepID=A0A345UKI4_9BACT|nr:beta-ketoacyl-ACP synthase III [Cyclonatronum proteinivorum]AXJ00986.1 3-oxoacyl-[acyl-carrier-protein] synthase-3 [Cyclonatronum proteinivorum]